MKAHGISGNLARLVLLVRDDASQALAIIRDARALDHLNTPLGLATARLREADILIEIGDYDQARDLVAESLSYLRQNDVRLDQRVWALEVLSIIAYETDDMTLSTTLLLEILDIQMSEGFKPTWDERPAAHLARVLLDRNADDTARRVLNEYQEVEHIKPVSVRLLQVLQEQEARLELFRTDSAVDDDLPLIDAVRQALTGPPAIPQD